MHHRLRLRLGVGVSQDGVRALLVRRGRVRWHGETQAAGGESLADTIARVVAQAPIGRLSRPRLSVALGPSLAQLKPLVGLPPVSDARLLTRLVREGVSRFFLVPARGLVVPDVRRRADDSVWAAALDAGALHSIQQAASRTGLRLECVVPTVAVLHRATSETDVAWADGGRQVSVRYDGGEVTMVRRTPEGIDPAAVPSTVAALARFGAAAWQWADAYGAAYSTARTPHAWHPALADGHVAVRRRLRLAALGVAAMMMAVLAVVAPGVRATRELRAAERALARSGTRREAAARAEAELRRVTTRLERVERFRGEARSFTLMLGSLSLALPESTALLTLRVDSLEGSFLALTPRAAEILPALVALPFVRDPRIVGSVTRELVAGTRLERANVRFKLPRHVVAPTPPARR